jgi:hypothetical protein
LLFTCLLAIIKTLYILVGHESQDGLPEKSIRE